VEKKKILIVEDDISISELLCQIVVQMGHVATPSFSGTEATLLLKSENFDLVLLDLMLPGLTGEEVLKEIRKKSDIPVIAISGKLEIVAKLEVFEGGADDYITKPFDVDEVMARIQVCLRRSEKLQPISEIENLKHKGLTLELDTKKVFVSGIELKVTSKEFEILRLLLENPQKVFSKANLYESVWGDNFYGDDNAVKMLMSRLRTKLNKVNPTEEYIETLWGIGFRLKE